MDAYQQHAMKGATKRRRTVASLLLAPGVHERLDAHAINLQNMWWWWVNSVMGWHKAQLGFVKSQSHSSVLHLGHPVKLNLTFGAEPR